MIVWVVKNGKWEKWKRTGKCKQCGACCRDYTITFSMRAYLKSEEGGKPIEEWSQEEKDRSDGAVHFWSLGMWWKVNITEISQEDVTPCEDLTPEGKCLCWQDFDRFKALCLYWPMDPYAQKHFPDCGFSFKRIEEVSEDEEEA